MLILTTYSFNSLEISLFLVSINSEYLHMNLLFVYYNGKFIVFLITQFI
jgi:hypothetical protein